MLRAGKLANRVTIESRATTVGTRGESTGAWSTAATVWAGIDSLSGNEAAKAREVFASASLKITMRNPDSLLTDGLSTKMRINFGGRIMPIGYIDRNDQGGEFITLICGEQAP